MHLLQHKIQVGLTSVGDRHGWREFQLGPLDHSSTSQPMAFVDCYPTLRKCVWSCENQNVHVVTDDPKQNEKNAHGNAYIGLKMICLLNVV